MEYYYAPDIWEVSWEQNCSLIIVKEKAENPYASHSSDLNVLKAIVEEPALKEKLGDIF